MNKKRIIVSGYANLIRGKPTLSKIVNDYFYENENGEAISLPWKAESTRRQYINDIVKRLIPQMDNYIPVEDYTQEDVVQGMHRIQKMWNYDEKTMAHYRLLFWRIYNAGVSNGLYEDKLHWEELDIVGRNQNNSAPKRRLSVQRRTLSINDERKLLSYFANLNPEFAVGEDYGLLLMYVITLRNQEVVALDFGDLRRYTQERVPAIYVYKSSGINTSKVKGGGKTSNMFRILPLLDFADDIIAQRKKYLQKIIEDGGLKYQGNTIDIETLPIVCKGNEFNRRCQSGDISNHARMVFDKLGIAKDALDEATRQLYIKSGIEEESATAYLLRRNALNHLWCLSLNRDELEYCMGHYIDNASKKRNDFTNEDEFLKLKHKIDNHPANAFFKQKDQAVVVDDNLFRSDFGGKKEFILPSKNEDTIYYIDCISNEAGDDFVVTSNSEVKLLVFKSYDYANETGRNTVDITGLVNNLYSKEKRGDYYEQNSN